MAKKSFISNEEIKKIAYEIWKKWCSGKPKEQVLKIKKRLLKDNQVYWKFFKSVIKEGSNPTKALLKVIADCTQNKKI